jgi:predicted SAM-dependent methyltransferase
MKKFAWLPDLIRDPLVLLRNRNRQLVQKRKLERLSLQSVKKIIVGSEGTHFEGWVTTEQDVLNLVFESDWDNYFKKNSLDAILAEHVWEHLTPKDSIIAARNCFSFLKPGGYIRVAVPDGYHPDPTYIEGVKPGGSGAGAEDHKVLYTYDTFREAFSAVGFDVTLLEYFDEHGKFIAKEWSASDGFIERSKRFDSRNTAGNLSYTSIVLDARKPVDQHE